jgi:hypothetical protein
MSDVTKGFRDGRFLSLSERDKRDVLKLMARVAEQAYRRGAQQGAGLAQRPCFRADLGEWRYQPSLDLSPWVDSPRMTTSLERLDGECGEALRRSAFPSRTPPRADQDLGQSPGDAPCGRAIPESSAVPSRRSAKKSHGESTTELAETAPSRYE